MRRSSADCKYSAKFRLSSLSTESCKNQIFIILAVLLRDGIHLRGLAPGRTASKKHRSGGELLATLSLMRLLENQTPATDPDNFCGKGAPPLAGLPRCLATSLIFEQTSHFLIAVPATNRDIAKHR